MVMFRVSNDGGQTFGDKINLSNSTDAESQNAEIVAAGDKVFVSWWETSPETGSSESVLRISPDAGQTFGPMIMLGVNGTISTTTGNTTESTATTTAEQEEEEVLLNGPGGI
jgi:Ni,Fe-hydrogenase I small subunit